MVDDHRLPLLPGEVPEMRKVRFRTLGCYPLTGAIDSQDDTLEAIIDKLTRDSERHGTTGRGNLELALLVNGLPGAGKSTIANLVEQRLHATGCGTMSLDGENVHHGLCRDLGFTPADRVENIRRVAHVAQLMAEAGLIVLVSLISPFRAAPEMARSLWPPGEFLEIFVDTPLDICEARDVKGLYRKRRAPAPCPTSQVSAALTSPRRNLICASTPVPGLRHPWLMRLCVIWPKPASFHPWSNANGHNL